MRRLPVVLGAGYERMKIACGFCRRGTTQGPTGGNEPTLRNGAPSSTSSHVMSGAGGTGLWCKAIC